MLEERVKDLLLMAIGIQLSIVGTAPDDGSLQALFVLGVFISGVVILRESGRRLGEYLNER